MTRRFELQRDTDPSGVSGTGAVTEGIEFSDGVCAMRWITGHRSTCIFDSIDELMAIHGHNGGTRLFWLDPDHDGEYDDEFPSWVTS